MKKLGRSIIRTPMAVALLPLLIYLCTFKLPFVPLLVGFLYFILIATSGRMLFFFRIRCENPLLAWTLASFCGMGIFQFLWFAANLIHVDPLWPLLILAVGVLAAEKKIARKKELHRAVSSQELVALLLLLVFCIAITFLAFANFGRLENGYYHYRFSFNAASTKNMAMINLLQKKFPFENPYFKGEPFHFYYLSYVLPAALRSVGLSTTEAFFVFQAVTGYLCVLLFFCFIQYLTGRIFQSLVLTGLGLFAMSAEGFYFIAAHFKQFLVQPLFFRNLNHLDGITFIYFQAPLVDTLYRAIMFSVTHVQSLSFLLIGLLLIKMDKEELAPMFMVFSIMSSFFIGGSGFLFLGIWVLFNLKRLSRLKKYLLSLTATGAATLLFMMLTSMLGHEKMHLVFFPLNLHRLLASLLLNFGLSLPLAVAGFLIMAKREKNRYYLFLLALVLLALFLSFFMRIEPLNDDVPNKLCMALQALLTSGLIAFGKWKKAFATVCILIALTGLPTFLGGLYSYQDYRQSQFTLRVPANEMAMARWIERNTPADAIIQTYPSAREDYFSLIPVFAARGMAVGDAVHGTTFLISQQVYRQKLAKVEAALRHVNDSSAVAELKNFGINYILWSKPESEVMPQPQNLRLVQKFKDCRLYALD